ncbi:thiol-disulfide oxidoreductase DCC family protein [Peredibacter starrii]|uniref:DCC1-like thiol-disulfide oxidoreductase family protein n=1 Tax=Peredibacter starrii TaxID=28202 RepID=A0AAX4HR72_9BACT|nr:DCC1-like thiol-disulfide oxidoreductase family protein [Peredibacter starrii]WPU65789.1 DCC1-like thiol-disulfide oxidoreductase family protein [Peredibacter starrii]
MKYHLPLVLYDPECPLCVRFKQGLEYLDKSLNFVSVREDEVYTVFPELSRQDCISKVHLITPDKEILTGPEVVDYLVKTLPGVSKLSWLLDNEQGQKVKNYFYEKVEELRELTQKKQEECDQCPRRR